MQAKKSTSTSWSKPFLKSQFCNGTGLVIEGTVIETRVHSMFVTATAVTTRQEDNLPTRFFVLTLEPKLTYTRLYRAKDGQEVDYTENIPKSRDYHAPQLLNFDQLAAKVGGGSALPNGLLDEQKANLHPRVKGRFEFWVDSEKPRAKELAAGNQLRILTLGESIFVDDFKFLNAKINVFKDMGEKGADLSNEYAQAIMNYAEPEHEVADDREGVAEDEWSD